MITNFNPIFKDKVAAWAVHGFTASGIILGFLSVVAVLNNDQGAAFLWLGLALLVDGIDGTLARKVRVNELFQRLMDLHWIMLLIILPMS